MCRWGLIDPPLAPVDVPLRDARLAQFKAGELTFCSCRLGENAREHYTALANPKDDDADRETRRRAYLERVDGLKPHERGITFERIVLGAHNRPAYDAIRTAVALRSGLVTLTGPFGVGKSVMLMAAVNECRTAGVTSVYTTMTDLLDWLRAAFNPNRIEEDGVDLSFERRWKLLTTCTVLAIDEIDEMNPTPWALERLYRIFDERWRNLEHMLTLCALNRPVTELPGKVASRLRDGRGKVVEIKGADMRPYQERGK